MSERRLLPNGCILRFSLRERIIHWIAGITFVYLLLTGLAFWTPWLYWLATAMGGPTISRVWHFWFGWIWMGAVLVMFAMWAKEMKETPGDKKWWENIGHYTRNEDDQMPPTDRFNPGQKMLFWGFITFGILLLLSGIVLWFTADIPWSLRWLRYTAVLVHAISALFAIGLFMLHVYMGTALERGSFSSMIHGDVSRAWARKLHRVWFDHIMQTEAPKK